MIEFVFNEKRAAQAAAWLLRRHGGSMEYFKLIKLLYLADRRVFIETGLPITGDRMVSMEHGPVLSGVYDLIRDERAGDGSWCAYVSSPQGNIVRWTGREDDEEMSDGEREALDEVHAEFGSMGFGQLRHATHQLDEWHDPGKSSNPINPREILASAGLTALEIDVIADDARAFAAFKRKYGR